MSYQSDLERLQTISTAIDSTDAQCQAARDARDILIDNAIKAAYDEFDANTAELNALVAQLGAIIGKIEANQISGTLDEFTSIATEITNAARGP